MIGTIDVNIQAARPDFPLTPLKAFVNSPSSVRVRNVPKKIGKWDITAVTISANYPDNTTKTASCVLTAGVWVGTLAACGAVGTSGLGYSVIASGTDESGAAVTGYILGKGDVEILSTDGTITIGETCYYLHLLDSVPAIPHKGDLVKISGVWKVWNGAAWETLGGGGGGGGIEEYANREAFPATGVIGILYVAKDTNKLYRWASELTPAAYAEVSPQSAVAWGDVTGKPESFTPSAHASTHGTDGADPIDPASIGAVTANAAITSATKCKVTYDAKGLVTAGADLTAADIPDLSASYDVAGAAATAKTEAIAACVKKQGESSQSVEGQLSVGSLYVGGTRVEVVSAVPASPIADTLYFVTGS